MTWKVPVRTIEKEFDFFSNVSANLFQKRQGSEPAVADDQSGVFEAFDQAGNPRAEKRRKQNCGKGVQSSGMEKSGAIPKVSVSGIACSEAKILFFMRSFFLLASGFVDDPDHPQFHTVVQFLVPEDGFDQMFAGNCVSPERALHQGIVLIDVFRR